MSWNEEKVNKLKELWGKGNTASQIAEIIGGISRNAVIGKAHRLNLSAKIKTRKATSNQNFGSSLHENSSAPEKRGRKSKFRSLIIEKDFEPENPKQLEELDENSCKWPIGHPDEKSFYFCGRSSLKDFSYCKLHLLYAYQPKGKKEELVADKDEVPEFIEKKIQSA
jgi:GcrA cell cycle regulator